MRDKSNDRHTFEQEFEALFRKNYDRLYYTACDWVEDAEVARDVVSDVFGELWVHYERLRNENLDVYLFRSVRNRCMNHLRHKVIEGKYQDYFLAMKVEAMDEDEAEREARLREIDRVMDSFTSQTRFIFEQCYFEGRKYKEVGDELNISVSAVHKHMNKAFAMLRAVFNKKKTD